MHGNFKKDIVIQSSVDAIYHLVSHPQQMVGLQPLIKDVEILEESETEDGIQTYTFIAFEHIRVLGILPMVNRINTQMQLENPPFTLYQVGRTRGITLYQTINLIEKPNGTQVTNAIKFEVHPLLFLYVRYEINRAHTAWLDILKQRAESS